MLDKLLIIFFVINVWYSDYRVIREIKSGVHLKEIPIEIKNFAMILDGLVICFIITRLVVER